MCPEDFVVQHNLKYNFYCEAVILSDGDIQYAIPSHQQKLVMLYDISMQEIYDCSKKYQQLMEKIPMTASPLHWMCEDLNVVSVWYDFCVVPISYTSNQLNSLKYLKSQGCISPTFDVVVTDEKSLTDKICSESVTEKDLEALINRKLDIKMKINKLLFEKTE